MIFDYHLHTKASPDATGTMEEYVSEAKKKGIGEIGFSDHIILRRLIGRSDALARQMPSYIRDFVRAKEKSKIPIKLGVKMDFFPDNAERIRRFIQKHPFDYVMGSVHMIGGWIIDDPSEKDEYSRRNVSQICEEYFDLVKKLCASRLFDVLAHPDLIKIFGARPEGDFSPVLEEVARTMAKSNICAEINTKGLRGPCKEIYPGKQFLKILYDHGVPVTFGSDAHEPGDVGRDMKKARNLVREIGYFEACMFDQRQKMPVKI